MKQQIDNVKDVMVDNIGQATPLLYFLIPIIDRVLERGEKIELLVDKTDKLSHQAYKFEKTVHCFPSPLSYLLSNSSTLVKKSQE